MTLLDIPGPEDKVVSYEKMEVLALNFEHPQVVLSRTYHRNGDVSYYVRKGRRIVWQKKIKGPPEMWAEFEKAINGKL